MHNAVIKRSAARQQLGLKLMLAKDVHSKAELLQSDQYRGTKVADGSTYEGMVRFPPLFSLFSLLCCDTITICGTGVLSPVLLKGCLYFCWVVSFSTRRRA